MNEDDEEGKIKFTEKGSLEEWCCTKSWALRCFTKQIEELAGDAAKFSRCIEKACCLN